MDNFVPGGRSAHAQPSPRSGDLGPWRGDHVRLIVKHLERAFRINTSPHPGADRSLSRFPRRRFDARKPEGRRLLARRAASQCILTIVIGFERIILAGRARGQP
jgi:hypothetical protein